MRQLRGPQAIQRTSRSLGPHFGIDDACSCAKAPGTLARFSRGLNAVHADRVQVPALSKFAAGGHEADIREDAWPCCKRDVGDRVAQPVGEGGELQ